MRGLAEQTLADDTGEEREPTTGPWQPAQATERTPVQAQGASNAQSMFTQLSRRRHRLLSRLLSGLTLVGLALVASEGPSPLNLAVGGALVVQLLAFLRLYQLNRNDEGPHARDATHRVVLVVAMAAIPEFLFFGVFGVVPPMVAFLVFLYASGDAEPKSSRLLAWILAVPHAVFSVLIALGVMEEPGLFSSARIDAVSLTHTAVVSLLYFLAIRLGHRFRAENHSSTTRLEKAVADVAAREALLQEARRELERARNVRGPGRLTDQVLGNYLLGVVIGRGGMGEVYEARHTENGSRAALKVLRGSRLGPAVLRRFEREAQVVARLQHPNVVNVLEVGGEESPLPYFAMEYLEGETLAEILAANQRLAPIEVAKMVRQISEGLEAARSLGVVHRDIKPANLFRARNGNWKLVDFGIACLPGRSQTLTGGALLGTPRYMAPEQLESETDIDHRTDVHALAAVAYRALTGNAPFAGVSLAALTHSVLHSLPTTPSETPGVPEEVDAVLRVGMAKSVDDRLQTARAFATHLSASVERLLDESIAERAAELDKRLTWRSRPNPSSSSDDRTLVEITDAA